MIPTVHIIPVSLLLILMVADAAADPVDDYVRAAMADKKIPGVSLVILRSGNVVKSRGYGLANLEHDVAATEDTIYQSGSVGKQFTAAGILMLAEDGKLGLDDRLVQHFPDGPASWHRITIRHLLTHTSGLKDYGPDEVDFRRDYTEDEYLDIIKRIPIEFEPGTQWSYSNTGYLLLGILTSRVAGRHWSEFLADQLFNPLGMTTTRVISERDIVMHRAAGYELDEQARVRNQEWVAPSANRCADGALYFSVKDLAAWEVALRASEFLGPESFEAWWTPVSLTNGTTYPYGFGWSIGEQRGSRLIEHGGSWQGLRAAIARYVDQELTIAVLSNLAQAEPEIMAHEIAGLVEPSLRMPDPDQSVRDPDGERTARLRRVLEAWADYDVVPPMGKGLAETASGSSREAYLRATTGRHLEGMTGFRYLDEDDLSAQPISMRGEPVERIVYYALELEDSRYLYRFRLTGDGRVVDFDSEER